MLAGEIIKVYQRTKLTFLLALDLAGLTNLTDFLLGTCGDLSGVRPSSGSGEKRVEW